MCMETNRPSQDRLAHVWEGWYRAAMRYKTESERYAALTTILDMCFQGRNYVPPEEPADRDQTDAERAVLQMYDAFHGSIFSRTDETSSALAKAKRIADGYKFGKMGGRGHKKGTGESSVASESEQTPSKPSQTNENGPSGSPVVLRKQTPDEAAEAAAWQQSNIDYAKSIKSPEDLAKWIRHNYMGGFISEMMKPDFLEFAYERLAASGWRSLKTNLPIHNLGTVLPLIRDGYKRYLRKKAEEKAADEAREAAKKAKEEPEQTQQDIDDFCQRMNETEYD